MLPIVYYWNKSSLLLLLDCWVCNAVKGKTHEQLTMFFSVTKHIFAVFYFSRSRVRVDKCPQNFGCNCYQNCCWWRPKSYKRTRITQNWKLGGYCFRNYKFTTVHAMAKRCKHWRERDPLKSTALVWESRILLSIRLDVRFDT